MQINEDGLRLISNNNDTNCISSMVRDGHRYLMFYLEHVDNISAERDDGVQNPATHLPTIISPIKGKREEEQNRGSGADQNIVACSFAHDNTVEGTGRGKRRSRASAEVLEDDLEEESDDDEESDEEESSEEGEEAESSPS